MINAKALPVGNRPKIYQVQLRNTIEILYEPQLLMVKMKEFICIKVRISDWWRHLKTIFCNWRNIFDRKIFKFKNDSQFKEATAKFNKILSVYL